MTPALKKHPTRPTFVNISLLLKPSEPDSHLNQTMSRTVFCPRLGLPGNENIVRNKFATGDWAELMLEEVNRQMSFRLSCGNLVVASVEELGFNTGTTTAEIYQSANSIGWQLCPAEIIMRLAKLNTRDLNRLFGYERSLIMASKPVVTLGNPLLFRLKKLDSGFELADICGLPNLFHKKEVRWMFLEG